MNEGWAAYLRRVMREAGYDPDGVRSGGRTRLAEDSGVSLPVISRSLNEGRTPDPKTLRALTGPLKRSYQELLIAAGHANEDDFETPPADGFVGTGSGGGRTLSDYSLAELADEIRRRADAGP